MSDSRYLTAQEAANELGISRSTLYAYVSRGLIRSEETGGNKRTRRYYREDIEQLKRRREQRQQPSKVAEQALHFGEPVLDSAITLIKDGQLFYRGQDATDLAVTQVVEQVAQLIWLGHLTSEEKDILLPSSQPLPKRCRDVLPQVSNLAPIEAFQILLPLAALDDIAAYSLAPANVAQTGARIMRLLALIAAKSVTAPGGLVQILQQSWVANDPQAAHLINAALILCADHELNVSSFTARCVASAGATPYAVVVAGLSALQGAKHGGYTERVEAFLRGVDQPRQVRTAIADRFKRGESVPGFGHKLYPDGDPRCTTLLSLMANVYPDSSGVILAQAITEEMLQTTGKYPTIDFGLAILAKTLNLPPGSALAIFALGRTIGWIGHAIEQYQVDQIIRPRARYVGQPPPDDFES